MRLGTLLMAGGGALLVASLWMRSALPAPAGLRTELQNEPVQEPTQAAPFQTTVGGVTYTIKPMADYEIWGLVVSEHDAETWWDSLHKAWNDNLNVVDVCVVFAENVAKGGYVGIDYSSGSFVCYAQTGSREAWQRFSMRALSNNHLLTDKPSIASKLRGMRVGDQVRIRGYLAEYSHNHGFPFKRGTSLTREDTGNGACETIYVQEAEVLKAGGGPWHALRWVAVVMIVAGFVLWFRAPVQAR